MVYICPSFRPVVQKLHYDPSSLQVVLGPLEKNFSSSFANMLRRIILRYTPGICIIGLKVHETPHLHLYSNIYGIKENVSEILTNVKTIVIQSSDVKAVTLEIKKKGPCIVRAKDIKCPEGIHIINSNQFICTLEFDVQMHIDLFAEVGCGFVPASYHGYQNNTIFCDTTFSPIKHVSFYVRSYTTYEELIFYIKTNKGCDPLFAFENALSFLGNKTDLNIKE